MSSKIQRQQIKTEAELITDGTTAADGMPRDDQVFVTASAINKTLKDAIIAGDIGGGGGSGSSAPYTLFNFQAEDYSTLPTFDTGNNVTPTPAAGGSFSGTLALNADSFQYTHGGSSTNDFFWSPVISFSDLLNNVDGSVGVYTDYDGTSGDMEAIFYDVTNSAFIGSAVSIVAGNGIFTGASTLATDVTQVRVGFKTITGNSTKILKFNRYNYDVTPAAVSGGTGAAIAYVKEVLSSGVDAGGITTSYVKRNLNNLTGDTSFLTLSANQITITSAGTYDVQFEAPAYYCDGHKAILRNTSDSTTDIIGKTSYSSNGLSDGDVTDSIGIGTLTLSGAKTFELQHRSNSARAGNGFGLANSYGDSEVYAQIRITKLT